MSRRPFATREEQEKAKKQFIDYGGRTVEYKEARWLISKLRTIDHQAPLYMIKEVKEFDRDYYIALNELSPDPTDPLAKLRTSSSSGYSTNGKPEILLMKKLAFENLHKAEMQSLDLYFKVHQFLEDVKTAIADGNKDMKLFLDMQWSGKFNNLNELMYFCEKETDSGKENDYRKVYLEFIYCEPEQIHKKLDFRLNHKKFYFPEFTSDEIERLCDFQYLHMEKKIRFYDQEENNFYIFLKERLRIIKNERMFATLKEICPLIWDYFDYIDVHDHTAFDKKYGIRQSVKVSQSTSRGKKQGSDKYVIFDKYN